MATRPSSIEGEIPLQPPPAETGVGPKEPLAESTEIAGQPLVAEKPKGILELAREKKSQAPHEKDFNRAINAKLVALEMSLIDLPPNDFNKRANIIVENTNSLVESCRKGTILKDLLGGSAPALMKADIVPLLKKAITVHAKNPDGLQMLQQALARIEKEMIM